MEELKKEILELMNKRNKALEALEISKELNTELEDICATLIELEKELKIRITNKGKYMLSDYKVGKISITKNGNGFLLLDDEADIFIDINNLNGALNGDTVAVELIKTLLGKRAGKVVSLMARDSKSEVGEVYQEGDTKFIKPDDVKKNIKIRVPLTSDFGVMPGHKVVIKLLNRNADDTYDCEIIRVIGHKNDPGIDILTIAAKYEINDIFPEEVIAETETIPDVIDEKFLTDRKDLRNEEIFTIDGLDAKDLDDAISLKMLDNGNYLLGVHIADVSFYVKEGQPLDKEAYERGTSVYLANRVIPMLPHKLSNGICSLNEKVDRFTLSCEMEINNLGEVVNYDIFEAVINSKKRMNYDAINSIIDNNVVPEGYEPFEATIRKMKELADILRANKFRRGYIDFAVSETEIIADETGKAIDVQLRVQGNGEKLIEDFMIAANETVASHIFYMELPFVYRIHGEPNDEKIKEFIKFVKLLGHKVILPKKYRPKDIQLLLDNLKGLKEFQVLSSLMLRSMQKAIYDTENIGHFGLGSKCYTHFTSPIRRYPDLIVHRNLRTYLFQKKIDKETINYLSNILPNISEHSSVKERAAVDCERDVNDMKMAEYMQEHIGEIFTGYVASALPFGMFIALPNGVEGLIKIETISDDYYFYDESTMSIRSAKNKRGYRIGDDIVVKCISANKETSQIDFEIYKETNEEK